MDGDSIRWESLLALSLRLRERKTSSWSLLASWCVAIVCLQVELFVAKHTTHGKKHTPEWKAWSSMRYRCRNPRCHAWEDYGGRGITVCQRWIDSFENFLADMGERPAGHSLDRIDSNGNYEPSNCRWATRIEQESNKRSNRILEWNDRSWTMSELAREFGMLPGTLCDHLKYGWSLERLGSSRPKGKIYHVKRRE